MAEVSLDRHARHAEGHRQQRVTVGVVSLLTVAGAALRMATINTRGLWLDEAISVVQANRTLPRIVETLSQGVHPPLYHILMHFWVQAFGSGEVAIRGFAAIWGILAIPIAYWAASVIFDRDTGLLAAALVAFSPYFIWYSQEARMYSMMLVFGLLSIGSLTVALRDGTPGRWIAYGAWTFFGLFTHYFFAFLVLGEVIYLVWFELVVPLREARRTGPTRFRWFRPWEVVRDVPAAKPWLITWAVIGTAYVLWLSRSVFMPGGEEANALVASASGSGLGYGQVPPSLALRFNDVGLVGAEMLAGFHPGPMMFALVAMWPLTIYLMLLALDVAGSVGRRSGLLLCSASGLVVVLVLGQWQGQVLASRYFMALAAPVVLLVAAALRHFHGRSFAVLAAILLVLWAAAWVDQSFNPSNLMRYDNREAIARVAADWRPGDVVIYEPFYLSPLFDYYMPKRVGALGFPQYAAGGTLRNGQAQLGQDLDRVVGPASRVWLVLSFQNIASLRGDSYNTLLWFKRNGFSVKEDLQMNQVRVIRVEGARPDAVPLGRGTLP